MRRIVARAPTRIDFVGGWTDVQPFCNDEAGLVVNAALALYARVVVTETDQPRVYADTFIAAACARFGLDRVVVESSSDAPLGSGLGGSGAVGVALVGALAAYAGQSLTRREVAELAHRIEMEDLGVIGGKQDQYAAAFGGFLALTFLGDTVEIEPLRLSAERVAQLQARSVVVYTGQSRVSGNIHAQVQAAFLAGNRDTLAALTTMRRVAQDFKRELEHGSLDAVGALLNENWDAQKRLHPSTTNARVDELFAVARNVGASGGKALGAGGGGCLYFVTKQEETAQVGRALEAAGARVMAAGFDAVGLDVQKQGI